MKNATCQSIFSLGTSFCSASVRRQPVLQNALMHKIAGKSCDMMQPEASRDRADNKQHIAAPIMRDDRSFD